MTVAPAAENHGDSEIWPDTYDKVYNTSIPAWTHSQNLLAAAKALTSKISSNGTSLKWSRRPSQSA